MPILFTFFSCRNKFSRIIVFTELSLTYLCLMYYGKRFIVATVIPSERTHEKYDTFESFEEFKELIRNLGGVIVGEVVQKRQRPDNAFFLGKGKVEEIEGIDFDVLAIDSILTSAQIANLRRALGREVVDREYIIIKIFAERAVSKEGKLQVKLAELKYRLAKLGGMGVKMSQLGGMPGTRGPGETKTEELRRHITNQIRAIENELETIRKTRLIQRERRKRKGFMTFSLVGYTNVGKSTILRNLTGEDVPVKNQLFTTLETRIGLVRVRDGDSHFLLPSGGGENTNGSVFKGFPFKILLSDTVGFIRNLPHSLVEAFKSTLEEVKFSDALLIVLDISSDYEKQLGTVRSVLIDEVGVDENKPYILVFNKIDLVSSEKIDHVSRKFPDAVFVSALNKKGFDVLKRKIEFLARGLCDVGENYFMRF